jgi:Flp pilus assembly protein TadB
VLAASRRGGRGTRRAAPATAPTAALAARKPRQGAPRARPAASTPPPRARPARRSGRGRLVGILLGLFALALVIVAIVVLTAPSPTRVVLRNVVYSDIQHASSALKQLVSENTK